jgi:molecular chaperone Hsp33
MDYILRASAGDGAVRIFVANTHDTVQKAFEIHKTSPVMSAALGRALTGVAIMGSMLKNDNDLVTITIKGDGPGKGLTVTSNSKSQVKGYVYNPIVDIPLKPNGKLDVQEALGFGDLTVIKDIGMKEPYVGTIPLISGEIAEDLTY